VVDREEGGAERIREAGYPFFRLYTARELLDARSCPPPGSDVSPPASEA
jgi:orotate phosphoribosyltransferase